MVNKEEFRHAGNISVDAGCVWIGDPCYVIHTGGENNYDQDLGEDWSDFSDRFLDRIGYNESRHSYEMYHHRATLLSHGFNPEDQCGVINNETILKLNEDGSYVRSKIDRDKVKQWIETNPYQESPERKGFALFGNGTGICTDTNEGDGSYPVYIRYGRNGRPSQVLIDFGDNE